MLPVMKAAFGIADPDNEGEYKDYITVQINPEQITHYMGSKKIKSRVGVTPKNEKDEEDSQVSESLLEVSPPHETLSMKLYFDIVSILEGLTEAAAVTWNLLCDLPSKSGRITPSLYGKLKFAAGNSQGISFYWGKMVFTGKITSFSSNYSYFGMNGNILRAEVDLTITGGQSEAESQVEKSWHTFQQSELYPENMVSRLADVASDLTRN